MKKMMIAIALSSLVATLAQAATGVLIESRTSGGMPMPGGHFYNFVVQVTDQGVIQTQGQEEKTTIIAKLSKSALQSLKTQIADLKEGKLSEPSGPECADAPGTVIKVTKADGREVVISEVFNCRPSEMEYAYSLINLMKNISSMASNLH